MFWFLLKKSFFDAWDNLGTMVLINLGSFLFVLSIPGLFFSMFGEEVTSFSGGRVFVVGFFILLLFFLFIVFLGTASRLLLSVSDYRRATFGDFVPHVRATWKGSLLFGFLLLVFMIVSGFGFVFYSRLNNFAGFFALALLFWLTVGITLSALWFFAVRDRLGGRFRVLLKRSVLVMLDNVGLSLFTGFIIVPIMGVLWVLTLFAGFGPAGLLLYLQDAMKILDLKYDWLKENSDAKKRPKIPWQELLVEERERVGPRTLKGMIFPWKN